MRIVITEFMDAPAVAALAGAHDTRYLPDLVDRPEALAAESADADALIVRNRTQVRGALLAGARRLRVVGRLGVGLDNIDVAACKTRGIAVIPASGANAQAVAEYVIGAALVLLRGAYVSSADVAAGHWPRTALSSGREIAGRTLGVVGFGDIGRRVARLGRALGMRAIAHDVAVPAHSTLWRDEGVEPRDLDALFAAADVVTLHVPLVEATRRLIDARALASMRRGAILVNTSRGGVVDEAALAASLASGHLGGAALDVFEHEPLPAGSVLADAPNLLLTPHVAGLTQEANQRVSTMIAERVLATLAGR
ncbi:MAG TPA: hydroxyacid dehydrogenase [Casimicrobiaceae bacterium]|nr:hydroxyacid dehydrogenase [Casimicrobiaceae bacterium]